MASDNLPALNFPFSTVFQQHILDGCLAQEIALVNRILDDERQRLSPPTDRKTELEIWEGSRGF